MCTLLNILAAIQLRQISLDLVLSSFDVQPDARWGTYRNPSFYLKSCPTPGPAPGISCLLCMPVMMSSTFGYKERRRSGTKGLNARATPNWRQDGADMWVPGGGG